MAAALMAPGRSRHLLSSGQGVLSARGEPSSQAGLRPPSSEVRFEEPVPEDVSKYSRRPTVRPQNEGFLVQETNKRLSVVRREKKEQERQRGKQLVEKLLEHDREDVVIEEAKQENIREKHRQLAQGYKCKIEALERERSMGYSRKLQQGRDEAFFPFVEGEHVNQQREEQRHALRKELRGFLQSEREANPPRDDALLQDVGQRHRLLYPRSDEPFQPPAADGVGCSPHIGGQHPRFLTRPDEHASRRSGDNHVRQALQDKVEVVKSEMIDSARRRQLEVQTLKDGMEVNDALRFDSALNKANMRAKNAQFVKAQIEERARRRDAEKEEQKGQHAGYWGPEEKSMQGKHLYAKHCNVLIQQMGVNQHRRLDDRHRQLHQERLLAENALDELRKDREQAQEKASLQREVLTTTWESQKKIVEALTSIEGIGN